MNPIFIWLMLPKETRDEIDAAVGDALLDMPVWVWYGVDAAALALLGWIAWTLLK